MKLEKAVQILKKHNKWRRGGDIKPTNPKELGVAIDTIVNWFDLKDDVLLKASIDATRDNLNDSFHIYDENIVVGAGTENAHVFREIFNKLKKY